MKMSSSPQNAKNAIFRPKKNACFCGLHFFVIIRRRDQFEQLFMCKGVKMRYIFDPPSIFKSHQFLSVNSKREGPEKTCFRGWNFHVFLFFPIANPYFWGGTCHGQNALKRPSFSENFFRETYCETHIFPKSEGTLKKYFVKSVPVFKNYEKKKIPYFYFYFLKHVPRRA